MLLTISLWFITQYVFPACVCYLVYYTQLNGNSSRGSIEFRNRITNSCREWEQDRKHHGMYEIKCTKKRDKPCYLDTTSTVFIKDLNSDTLHIQLTFSRIVSFQGMSCRLMNNDVCSKSYMLKAVLYLSNSPSLLEIQFPQRLPPPMSKNMTDDLLVTLPRKATADFHMYMDISMPEIVICGGITSVLVFSYVCSITLMNLAKYPKWNAGMFHHAPG